MLQSHETFMRIRCTTLDENSFSEEMRNEMVMDKMDLAWLPRWVLSWVYLDLTVLVVRVLEASALTPPR